MPESTLESCAGEESFVACKRRNRSRLAYYFTKRMLVRTPAEQAKAFDFGGDEAESQALCDPTAFMGDPVPSDVKDEPCAYRAGQIDDFFRYLEFGLKPTQIGSSDSHEGLKEPGAPRTWFRAPTDIAPMVSP